MVTMILPELFLSGTTDFLVPEVVFNEIVSAIQGIFNVDSDFFQGESCANFTDADLDLLPVISVRCVSCCLVGANSSLTFLR